MGRALSARACCRGLWGKAPVLSQSSLTSSSCSGVTRWITQRVHVEWLQVEQRDFSA
jgi:hypothetical protein